MSKNNSNWGKNRILKILEKEDAKIHFVGVGGVGMYSLFRLTEGLGISVSGSDKERSRLTGALIETGGRIYIGHSETLAVGKDLLVYTLAIAEDNPETAYANRHGIPTVSRAEYLGALMEKYRIRVGVSGSHGKSTVCGMLDAIFYEAGRTPTTLCGAALPQTASPLRLGGKEYFIYEACEYKDSFLSFSPTVSVFTNLELDHVDYFSGIEEIAASFQRAMDLCEVAVVNADDEKLLSLIPKTVAKVITFGECENADYRFSVKGNESGFYSFEILRGKESVLKLRLSVCGRFNVSNATAAAVAALELGIGGEDISRALQSFSGIERRIEKIGELDGRPVYYDYAHHPTEIECTIGAVREMTGTDVTVIFKPHTYSRTAGLMSDFVRALSLADNVLLCDIASIREREIEGVSSQRLAEMIGNRARRISENGVKRELRDSGRGAIIIMGAANLDAVKNEIIGK